MNADLLKTDLLTADLLITGIAQLVTAEGLGAKRGAAMRELRQINNATIACVAGRILWLGPRSEWKGTAVRTEDLGNRAVVPALIDPHTHAVWAGDRLADFEARTSGASYEQILMAGGGIRSTIRATARASREELVDAALPRIEQLLRSGATTIEVKSGYGFTVEAELAMLEAIQAIASRTPATIIPTLLIHIPPADLANRASYLQQICSDLIPEVARRKLAAAVDIFVEKEAWRPEEARQVLECAIKRGLAIKLHTEQFHRIGGLELGLQLKALSCDHLEACSDAQLPGFARHNTIATILPGVSLHLGIPVAPGRKLIDGGAAVAVGTDLNPGSSPLFSMAAAVALAVRLNGLTAQEALVAGTVNAAHALGRIDLGRIEVGGRADFLVLQGRDWRELVYTLGVNPVKEVRIGGELVAFA
jgi:imidazolonepropionase